LDDRRQAEREIERLHKLIAQSRETIKSLKSENASKKRSYSIIPYEGPNGTTRRPIYIECRADAVVVQPEGITLTQEDLSPPLDAGNPLAAALRAAREYVVQNSGASAANKQAEPYPLILVRPDGIKSYHAVRRAIASWDADFGYEFIGSEWKLEFPPLDPQLARLENQAVEQARIRRQVLAAAAPRAFRAGGFDAARRDFIEDGFGEGPSRGGGSGLGGGGGGPGHGGGTAAVTSSGPARGPTDQPVLQRNGPHGANIASSSRSGNASVAGVHQASTDSATKTISGTRRSSGGRTSGNSATRAGEAQDDASAGSLANLAGGVPGGETGNGLAGSHAAAPGTFRGEPAPDGAVAGVNGSAPAGGEGWTVNGGAGGPAAGGSQPTSPTSVGSSQGTGLSTLPPSQVHELPSAIRSQDLSESRGANWAVGGKGMAAVPVRRSIQVVVREDRIAILPEAAISEDTTGGREIKVEGPLINHIDDVVAAVQQQVNDWGIAGRGLYWRPVLVLQVGPDAEPRAAELAQLLKDSGIELRSSLTADRGQIQADRR
jgi:hypothetical protein